MSVSSMLGHLFLVGALFALVSSVVAVASTSNGSALAASQVLETPFPYYFPLQSNPEDLFPMPMCKGLTLEEATIDQLQSYMS